MHLDSVTLGEVPEAGSKSDFKDEETPLRSTLTFRSPERIGVAPAEVASSAVTQIEAIVNA